MASREIVLALRLSEGTTREQFRALKGALIDVRDEITQNNKALRENAKAQRELDTAVKEGAVTAEQAAVRSQALLTSREQLKTASANLASQEASLSSVYREVRNDVGGLTDAGLRFRDKMAEATIEALKQEGVLGKLGARMDFLRREQERLTQEQKDGKITQDQYRISAEKLAQEEKELGAQMAGLNAKVDALTKEFQQGKITQEEFRKGVNAINTSVENVGTAVNRGVQDLKNYALGFFGVVAAAQAAITAIKAIASTVADFDQGLANIRALGGEFADSIDRIGDAAIRLGPKLGIAPTEALKAFEALAKAGLDTEQILTGGLESALTLAAAGTIEVGQAAEITAASLTQFNLKGEQAGLVADLLAKGADLAQGGVDDFGAALNQTGLVANAFGLTIQETVGGLTAFAKAGLTGSDAGTSFKAALLRLQAPTEKARDVLDQYGITLVDAGGNFKNLEGIAGELQTKLGDLTQEQRAQALATIFGQDAIRVANILYAQGAEGIKDYTEKVNEYGFSLGVAEEKNNSISGSLRKLGSAFDAAVLSIDKGSGLASAGFRTMADAATELLQILAGTNEFQNFKNELEDVTDRARETANDTYLLTRSLRNLANALALKPEGLLEQIGLSTSQATKDVGGLLGEFNKLKEGIALTTDENGKLKELRIAPEDKVLELTEFARKLNFEIAKARAQAISGTLSEEDALKKQQALLILLKEKVTPAIVEANAARVKAAEDGAKASGKEVKAIGEEAAALDALKEKRTATAKEAAAVSGSVVDLTDQISALRKEQGQSTTSEQFQTYQTQIDALTQSVDVLTGKLSQDMVDAANAIPERLDPIISTAPLPDLAGQAIAPTVTDEEALAAVLALEQEYNRLSLENIDAYLAEKKALVDRYGVEAFDAAQARAQAQLDAEYAINAARLDAAGSLGQALTTLAKEGGAAAKIGLALQKASALASVVIDTQREIRAYWANPTWSLFPDGGVAIKTAATVGAITRAAASAAVISAQAIAGFAEGGEVNGDIKRSHGKPIRRSNGDNVLITAKAGEKILNEEQQEELERQHGKDVWKRIGLPGAKYGGRTRDSFLEINGYATGGAVTRGTALVNVAAPDLTAIESVAEARSFELSVVADIEEIVGVMDRRMRIIEMARG